MYAQVFAVIAPIFICALVGVIWARRDMPYSSDFVARLVMNIGAPCLIIATLGKVSVPEQQLRYLALITFLGLTLVALLSYLALRLLKGKVRVYMPSLLFANTGNMGLPLCLLAFGEEGLALALIIFMVTATLHFSIGVALVGRMHPLRSLFASPVFYAALLAVVLILTQWKLPLWISNTVGILGDMSIPLMLISLGVSLARLQVKSLSRALLYSVLRLGIGFSVGCLLVSLFALDGLARGVVLIQFSMPAAVFNYLLADRYGQSPQEVAGFVIVSTLISFLTLPLLLWFAYQ
jgi:hypothetical protein